MIALLLVTAQHKQLPSNDSSHWSLWRQIQIYRRSHTKTKVSKMYWGVWVTDNTVTVETHTKFLWAWSQLTERPFWCNRLKPNYKEYGTIVYLYISKLISSMKWCMNISSWSSEFGFDVSHIISIHYPQESGSRLVILQILIHLY